MDKIQNNKITKIESQLWFCTELMTRLKENIVNHCIQYKEEDSHLGHLLGHIPNHTRDSQDIIRLRRELVTLKTLLERKIK